VTQRWPAHRAAATGSLLLGAGMLAYGLRGGVAMIVAATVVNEVGQMIGGPTVFAWPAKAAPEGMAGRYLGSALAMFGAGQALGPILGLVAYHHLGRNFWWLCGVLGLVAAVACRHAMRPAADPASQPSHLTHLPSPRRGAQPVRRDMNEHNDGPLIVVGYTVPMQHGLDELRPPDSVIFVDEPDVAIGRGVETHLGESTSVRELITFEYQRPGAADAFFLAHADLRPSAVLPGVEYAVPFAARLAERYGVPGAGFGAAQVLRDKALLRTVTRAAGIANPRSQAVDGPDEVRAFMAEQGGPVILKPANRQASVGTKILFDPAEIDQAWTECTQQDEGVFVPGRGMPLRMLVEQYVEGDEYSVEMVVRDGERLFGNVTAKTVYPGPRPVELGHTVPADLPGTRVHGLGRHVAEQPLPVAHHHLHADRKSVV